ncbi:MAG: zinc ribbon domain-containing protein, partial [Candidatus Hydrogenedentes bacterium]|nr:zinc ribbon domain-containing protein [Candidatus Hydrogenedentota bacterium]
AGSFTPTVTFPQAVAFPLPQGARGIQATAQDATGALLTQPWEIVGGKLSYTLPQAGFQIEYYVDRPPAGNQRELNYTFEAPYAIQALEITVQQPARATGFAVTPQPASSYQGDDGLTYYRINRTNLTSGEKVPITIRYSKADQAFSVAPQTSSAPSAAQSLPAAAAPTGPSTLAYALIGLGLAVLAGAAAYWFVQRRAATSQPTRRTRPSVAPQAPVSGKAIFCTQCGRQLKPEDRFCASCGSPRKK